MVAVELTVPLHDLVKDAINCSDYCVFTDLKISRVEPSAALNRLFTAAASASSIEYGKHLAKA